MIIIKCSLTKKEYSVKICKISEMPKNTRFLTTAYNYGIEQPIYQIYITPSFKMYAKQEFIK